MIPYSLRAAQAISQSMYTGAVDLKYQKQIH
jgi:hypothetical protein